MVGENNNKDVFIQDQVTPPIIWILSQRLNAVTLASQGTRGAETVTLVAGHNVVVGNMLEFTYLLIQYQVEVLSVGIDDVIVLAKPLPFIIPVAATVYRTSIDMNVDGSSVPVTFFYENLTINKYDLYTIATTISCNSAPDGSKFGNLAALTKGVLIGKLNPTRGYDTNAYNVKQNVCFEIQGFTVTYTDKGGGGGAYSVNLKNSWRDMHGIAIRIAPGEKVFVKVRDNLSALTQFRSSILGHTVE